MTQPLEPAIAESDTAHGTTPTPPPWESLPSYRPTTGAFRPDPQTRDEAISRGTATYNQGSQIYDALNSYVEEHGGWKNFDETEGKIYRVTSYDDPDHPGKILTQKVQDDTATKLNLSLKAAEKDLTAYEKLLGKGGIFASTGVGASRPDTSKTDEVRRQFLDFLDRAKSLYGLEEEERNWSQEANKYNADNAAASMKGEISFDRTPTYLNQRPYGERLSDIVRPTIPTDLSPDYRMNDQVGLPGGGGFDYPRMGTGQGLPDFTQGFAEGTLPTASPNPQGGQGQVDPDIAWMIGFNPLAPHRGGPFDPAGKQLRGFKDASVQQQQPQQQVMPRG